MSTLVKEINTENKRISSNRFKYTNEEDYRFLKSLLEIKEVSGKENRIYAPIESRLSELNFSIHRDDFGNLYAIRGQADLYPAFEAHIDEVELRKAKRKSILTNSYNNTLLHKGLIKNTSSKTKELSYSEITKIWQETAFERECMWFSDYRAMGFTCENCNNGCKAYKLCFNFSIKEDWKTKSKYASCYNSANAKYSDNGVQESFDLSYTPLSNSPEKILGISHTEEIEPYKVTVNFKEDRITGEGGERVLGGDDKCGVFIILKVAELLPDMPMKILFTVQEETGLKGAKYVAENHSDWLSDMKYCVTIDRRGGNNLLWSQRGVRSCTDEFASKVFSCGILSGIDIEVQDGGSADVVVIRDYVPNAINISAGYYNAHKKSEYIVPSEVDKIVGWVKNIAANI